MLELATRLRGNGVDAILDQWDLGPGGDLPHFMEQSIAKSSRILMICTDRYVEKANQGTGGVGYEKMIVTADLIRQIGSNRVIPIVKQSGVHKLPIFLGSKLYINLSNADDFETGFDQLLRELLGAPLFEKPKLGTAPTLLAQPAPSSKLQDPVAQFMTALAKVYERSTSSGGIDTDVVQQVMGVSKLFFDHAFDLAIQRDFVHTSGMKKHMWVQPSGRAEMLQILAERKGSA